MLEDLQTYNEVCTLLGDLQKTIKSTLLKDLEIYFTCYNETENIHTTDILICLYALDHLM